MLTGSDAELEAVEENPREASGAPEPSVALHPGGFSAPDAQMSAGVAQGHDGSTDARRDGARDDARSGDELDDEEVGHRAAAETQPADAGASDEDEDA